MLNRMIIQIKFNQINKKVNCLAIVFKFIINDYIYLYAHSIYPSEQKLKDMTVFRVCFVFRSFALIPHLVILHVLISQLPFQKMKMLR